MSDRPELGALLDHVCLESPQPENVAAFLERAYGMSMQPADGGWRCTAPERTLGVRAGRANRVSHVGFAFASPHALALHRESLGARAIAPRPSPSPLFDGAAYSVADPDGNVLVFGVRARASNDTNEALPARLQHLAFRTPAIDAMAAFYESIGFVVSDRVRDEQGGMRACFLRSDPEHHSLALFGAADARFDHLSCETRDTACVIAWADRMAANGIPIHWGIGRHGPGNDVFFMVKDPDGNMIEISADLEVCAAGRAPGTWRHEQRTLNLWGNAIMRS